MFINIISLLIVNEHNVLSIIFAINNDATLFHITGSMVNRISLIVNEKTAITIIFIINNDAK